METLSAMETFLGQSFSPQSFSPRHFWRTWILAARDHNASTTVQRAARIWLARRRTAIIIQSAARCWIQRRRYSQWRDAVAHAQWLQYYLSTGQLDEARALGWTEMTRENDAAARIQSAWIGVGHRRRLRAHLEAEAHAAWDSYLIASCLMGDALRLGWEPRPTIRHAAVKLQTAFRFSRQPRFAKQRQQLLLRQRQPPRHYHRQPPIAETLWELSPALAPAPLPPAHQQVDEVVPTPTLPTLPTPLMDAALEAAYPRRPAAPPPSTSPAAVAPRLPLARCSINRRSIRRITTLLTTFEAVVEGSPPPSSASVHSALIGPSASSQSAGMEALLSPADTAAE